jgi:CHASE2 domain-containing sensor protein
VRNPHKVVLLAGIAATLLVVLLGALGALNRVEWRTQDVRFLHARRAPDPLSDRVRLVGIDDRALETKGRWPWPRALVAKAFDEIARAKPRAVAVDMLLVERQGAEPDAALAASIAAMPTVLAAQMDEGRIDQRLWAGAEGSRTLDALLGAIIADVKADPAPLAEKAGLKGARRASFLAHASVFKKMAIWRELLRRRAAGNPPASVDAFVLDLTHGDRALGDFRERQLVTEAFERDQAFGALAKSMGSGIGEGSPLDAPPIADLGRRAAGIAFVNSVPDADGEQRRVKPFWDTPYGAIPQLGLAAALRFDGMSPADVQRLPDALVLPDGRRIPLERGSIAVAWPTAMFEPVGAVVEEAAAHDAVEAERGTGVMAIGFLVDLAEQRERLVDLEARYRALGSDIAGKQGLAPEAFAQVPVDAKTRAAVKEQGEFLVGDLAVAGVDDLKDLTPEERALAGTYREWWRLDGGISTARARIAAAESQVRDELGGRLVFVGFNATGVTLDMINSVYGPRTPGVYMHAAVADMVLAGRSFTYWPAWSGLLAALVLGVACAFFAWRSGAGLSTTVMLVLVAGWVLLAGGWAFASLHLVIPVAVPVLAALASQAASVSTAAVVNQRERARITRQFRARVSPQLVDLLTQDPNAVSMRGQQRTSTILFGDLAGFTTISEKLGSEAVVATLNLYMGAMTKELTDRRAYVNKFLGDGILAFWSAFGEEPEQGQLAVEACAACQRAVQEIGRRPDRQELPPVSLRLGVATGVVTIGDCGAPPDLNDYTVIGDSANLAARLESANKQFGTAILFDGNTRDLIRDAGGLPIVPLGKVVVVGQSAPIDLFTMLIEDPQPGWIEAVGAAVQAFARADFAACAKAWDALEARYGPSKIAVPFRDAMAYEDDLRDGVLRLRAK